MFVGEKVKKNLNKALYCSLQRVYYKMIEEGLLSILEREIDRDALGPFKVINRGYSNVAKIPLFRVGRTKRIHRYASRVLEDFKDLEKEGWVLIEEKCSRFSGADYLFESTNGNGKNYLTMRTKPSLPGI